LQLNIEKLVYGGDGLARLPADQHGPGKAVFTPFVLEDELVEAQLVEQKPGFARAQAQAILRASPHRIEPQCPYFQRCGGCHYQHADYNHQLEIKASILRENLRRIARLELPVQLGVHPSPPWNYRNRARLRLRHQPDFALGYYRFNSHELLPVTQCPISSPLINLAITRLWEAGRAGGISKEISEIELFADAEDANLLVECDCERQASAGQAKEIARQLRDILPQALGVVAFRTTRPGVQNQPPVAVAGAGRLSCKTESAVYQVSAGSFFQVNRYLAGSLLKLVTAEQSGRLALDLFAGVGLFSTVLARSFAQVIAVESSPTSFANLQYNSPRNVKPVHATTERYLEARLKENEPAKPDLVVLDPPRGGLGERLASGLGTLQARRIIYVSCDPATLARDLKTLVASGYRIERAHLVDLFPQTYHLESVFSLIRAD